MPIHIRRREFIATLGGAATWPLAAHAQQPAMPVVGSEDMRPFWSIAGGRKHAYLLGDLILGSTDVGDGFSDIPSAFATAHDSPACCLRQQ